jgi:hypothetical protein
MTLGFAWKAKVERGGLKLACSVLGASAQRAVEVFPYALLDGTGIARKAGADPRSNPFLVFDEDARTITLKPGAWTLAEDLELPAGYTVIAAAPLKLAIGNEVRLTSRSPVKWTGLEEAPLEVVNDGELVLLQTNGRSELKRVSVSGAGRILLQQAPARIEGCTFSTSAGGDHITAVRSAIDMTDCVLAGGTDGLTLIASSLKAERCEVRGAKDDAMVVRGGSVAWSNGQLLAGKGAGLKLGVQGEATLEGAAVRSETNGIEVREGARLSVRKGAIEAKAVGILVKDMERISGPSTVDTEGTVIKAETEVEPGQGNAVRRDGRQLGLTKTSEP